MKRTYIFTLLEQKQSLWYHFPPPPLSLEETRMAPGVGPDCGTVSSRRSDAGSIARKLLIKCFGGCSHVIFLHQAIRDLKVFLSFQSSGLGFCPPLMDGPVP